MSGSSCKRAHIVYIAEWLQFVEDWHELRLKSFSGYCLACMPRYRYENAFALLKALHGTQLSDAQLDRATIAFLHSCGIEEENLFDKVSTMPRRLTDREFSIWHIRQASRSQRPTQLRSGRAGNNVETRSRMRVPRYVFERMLVDNVAVQRMMTMEFHLERARY